MKESINPFLVSLILCGMLAAGCRTSRVESHGKAAAIDEAALEMRTRAHAHYAAAVIHDVNDAPEPALQEYYKAALYDPADESLTLEISRRLILARQFEKALELLRTAAARPDASGAISARLSLVCLQLDRTEQAIEAGLAAIKKSPLQLAGYQSLFRAYLTANRGDEAVRVLDQATRQSDADAEFLTGLAELYAGYVIQFPSKRPDIEPRTLAVLERAAEQKPVSAMLQLRLADGFSMMDKPERAAEFYEQALGELEYNPPLRDSVRTKLVEIYLRTRDYKRANVHLEELIHDDPSHARAYYLLGSIAHEEKRWTDAADYFEKSVLFSPSFEQAYYDLAATRIAAGQSSQALTTLEMARGRFPQSFVMEFMFGVAYSQSKAYTEAFQHFTAAEVIAKAGDTNRLTEGFYFQFAVACERKGDSAQAEKYFQKAIEIAPNFAEALNYLGYMWAERGERLEEAKGLIERALKVEPGSAAYVDSLGWVLFKMGQTRSALEHILKAVDLSEEPDAELYHHLGDIYAALNEPDKARDAWRKALAVHPNETIQKKLDGAKLE